MITLVKNPDIAAEAGRKKREDQILVGFALETDNAVANAQDKLARKNLDMIVLNSLSEQTGFGVDTNKVTVIERSGTSTTFDLKSKVEVAKDIVNLISEKA